MRGFTLIELILVMALVAILAVVGLGSYNQATMKSRDTERKNDLNQITKALETFNNDVGRYPEVNNDGDMTCPGIDDEQDCNGRISAYFNGALATYMQEVPADPIMAREYVYIPDDGMGAYSLYAALENVEDKDVVVDAEGEATDWGVDCGSSPCNYKITETGLKTTLE
jgi:prepilin-type N-terminal cleavage/methylation domain-containing protein